MESPRERHAPDLAHRAPVDVPVLHGERVTLRGHRQTDAAALCEQCLDADTIAYTTVPLHYTVADSHEFISLIADNWATDGKPRAWALEFSPDGETPRYAGTIELRMLGSGLADVGFAAHPAARGKGLMAEALRLVCAWFFEHQAGSCVTWKAQSGNLASWRVAQAAGFTLHGTVPMLLPGRTGPVDGYHAALRHNDSRAPKSRWFDADQDITHIVGALPGIRLRAWREDDIAHIPAPQDPPYFMRAESVPTPLNFDTWLLRRKEDAAFGRAMHWCIADDVSDVPLGDVEIVADTTDPHIADPHIAVPDTAELGYQLFPGARGRGLAKVVAKAAAAWAFAPPQVDATGRPSGGLGVRRLQAKTVADNHASMRVLSALGFSRCGVEPDAVRTESGAVGLVLWHLSAATDGGVEPISVDVSIAGESDWRRVRAIRIRALAESPEAFCNNVKRTQELTEQTHRERLRDGDGLFMAVAQGLDVGMVGLLEDDGRLLIWGMWVDPTMRGLGVGTKLLDACVAQAERLGHDALWLDVFRDNETAVNLYRNYGFERSDEQAANTPEGCDLYRLPLTR